MTWTLSASGHCDDETAETALVDKLREALAGDDAGTSTATIYTQHHGQVDLTEPAGE